MFIFELIYGNKLVPLYSLILTSFGGNYQFIVYQNTLLINFNDMEGSKVAEVFLDLPGKKYQLVRFFKSS